MSDAKHDEECRCGYCNTKRIAEVKRLRAEAAERERDEARALADQLAGRLISEAERALADRLAGLLREWHAKNCFCPGPESGCPEATALAEHAAARKEEEKE